MQHNSAVIVHSIGLMSQWLYPYYVDNKIVLCFLAPYKPITSCFIGYGVESVHILSVTWLNGGTSILSLLFNRDHGVIMIIHTVWHAIIIDCVLSRKYKAWTGCIVSMLECSLSLNLCLVHPPNASNIARANKALWNKLIYGMQVYVMRITWLSIRREIIKCYQYTNLTTNYCISTSG